MTLYKTPLKGPLMCMHYSIFTVDSGFEPACITPTRFASLFHGFVSDFWTMIIPLGKNERRDHVK